MKLKAITIHQPWATLLALGEKIFETRGWATSHRGETAIHAGMKIDREACEREPIKSTLAKHGYTADNLPTGSILAIATLEECYKTRPYGLSDYVELVSGDYTRYLTGPEFFFGDFSKGRFAWEMRNVQQLPEPIPAKGYQRLWNWSVSE